MVTMRCEGASGVGLVTPPSGRTLAAAFGRVASDAPSDWMVRSSPGGEGALAVPSPSG